MNLLWWEPNLTVQAARIGTTVPLFISDQDPIAAWRHLGGNVQIETNVAIIINKYLTNNTNGDHYPYHNLLCLSWLFSQWENVPT